MMGNSESTPTSASTSVPTSSAASSPSLALPAPPHQPSCSDVAVVRAILQKAARSPAAPVALPPELVDMVIDAAEYWPSTEVKLSGSVHIQHDGDRECLRTKPLCYDTADGSTALRLRPHRDLHPCRKVEFSIRSHDQGWGGGPGNRGTYNQAYSWFDAFIVPMPGSVDSAETSFREVKKDGNRLTGTEMMEPKDDIRGDREGRTEIRDESGQNDGRADNGGNGEEDNNTHNCARDNHDLEPESRRFGRGNYFMPAEHTLQRNVVAHSMAKTHTITWHCMDSIDPDSEEAEEIQNAHGRGRATLDGRAVRDMNVGDSIVVWVRARFPGWQNIVEGMSIRVFWAV